ncbi:trypsin-like serine peptidase [Pseudonocardia spirodelae]|uniref:Serine protease n=1 Tax=Pseudonocardia spirodelae TaxID=3133431 RepID=A0ABU8T6C9_9PSEU
MRIPGRAARGRTRLLAAGALGAAVLAAAVLAGRPAPTAAAPAPAPEPATTAAVAAPVTAARPATGALFAGPADDPGEHYCSAAVVTSAAGDLVVTAAHCVADGDGSPARTGMSFAPGYDDGTAPYGYWTVTAATVPPGWEQSGDPASDVAFLTVEQPGSPPVQQLTGAYRLAPAPDPDTTAQDDGSAPTGPTVTAVGYNDGDPAATTVSGTVDSPEPGQWELPEPGLDDGTSGGPWLTGPDGTEILAVTGGLQQGGDTPDVSYAADLGDAARAAYASAGGED